MRVIELVGGELGDFGFQALAKIVGGKDKTYSQSSDRPAQMFLDVILKLGCMHSTSKKILNECGMSAECNSDLHMT